MTTTKTYTRTSKHTHAHMYVRTNTQTQIQAANKPPQRSYGLYNDVFLRSFCGGRTTLPHVTSAGRLDNSCTIRCGLRHERSWQLRLGEEREGGQKRESRWGTKSKKGTQRQWMHAEARKEHVHWRAGNIWRELTCRFIWALSAENPGAYSVCKAGSSAVCNEICASWQVTDKKSRIETHAHITKNTKKQQQEDMRSTVDMWLEYHLLH